MLEEFDTGTHEVESPEPKSPESLKSPESPKSTEKVKWETPNHYGVARQYRIGAEKND
jgi:hypothetical protein